MRNPTPYIILILRKLISLLGFSFRLPLRLFSSWFLYFCRVRTGILLPGRTFFPNNNSKIFVFFNFLNLKQQGYPQRMRLQRRLYGIYTVCFVIFRTPLSEFNEFKSRLKSHKNRFQLSAGFNLEKLNTILKRLKIFKFGLLQLYTGFVLCQII